MNQMFPVLYQPAPCVNPTGLVGICAIIFLRERELWRLGENSWVGWVYRSGVCVAGVDKVELPAMMWREYLKIGGIHAKEWG